MDFYANTPSDLPEWVRLSLKAEGFNATKLRWTPLVASGQSSAVARPVGSDDYYYLQGNDTGYDMVMETAVTPAFRPFFYVGSLTLRTIVSAYTSGIFFPSLAIATRSDVGYKEAILDRILVNGSTVRVGGLTSLQMCSFTHFHFINFNFSGPGVGTVYFSFHFNGYEFNLI